MPHSLNSPLSHAIAADRPAGGCHAAIGTNLMDLVLNGHSAPDTTSDTHLIYRLASAADGLVLTD